MKPYVLCFLLGSMLLLGLNHPARAVDAVAFEGGMGEDTTYRGGFGMQWDWGVEWLPIGDWYLGGYWEASFSYWDGEKGRTGTESLGEFGLAPVFRIQSHNPVYGLWPYLEGAVGIHVMTEEELGDKDFSIPFTFGDHVGTGACFGEKGQFELGYRFQHLSNLSLGDSNPGINFHIARFVYHF